MKTNENFKEKFKECLTNSIYEANKVTDIRFTNLTINNMFDLETKYIIDLNNDEIEDYGELMSRDTVISSFQHFLRIMFNNIRNELINAKILDNDCITLVNNFNLFKEGYLNTDFNIFNETNTVTFFNKNYYYHYEKNLTINIKIDFPEIMAIIVSL